jgi:hypothetical protein
MGRGGSRPNAGRRPTGGDTPSVVGDPPTEPAGLGTAGSAAWQRLRDLLSVQGRLGAADGPLLEAAARSFDVVHRLGQLGATAEGEMALRFAAAERAALSEYRRALVDLLLTPSTAGRVPREDPGLRSWP